MYFQRLLYLTIILLGLNSTSIQAELHPYQLNVYTFENIGTAITPYGSDFQGPSASGGDAYFSGFTGNALGPSYGGYSMYTGGSFNLYSGEVKNGGIESGGNVYLSSTSIQGNVHGGGNLQGGYGTINGNVSISGINTSLLSISGTVSSFQPFTPSVNLPSISNYFQNASTFWSGLAPTATVTNVFGQLQVSSLTSGRNVVNLSLADLNGAWGIQLNGPADAFVIFNILDLTASTQLLKDVTFNLSGGMDVNDVLYNIANATDLKLQGGQYLSILAPHADISFPSGLVTGNLIADNLFGSGQVNLGSFTGFGSDEHHFMNVPEPSTYLLMGSFLVLVAFVGYKRRASHVV